MAEDRGSVIMLVCGRGRNRGDLPLLLVGLGELNLYAIDAVYAVNEEDQDKDEGNLHAILQFCYQRTLASTAIVRLGMEAGGS